MTKIGTKTAGGFLLDREGRILLGLRSPHKRVAPSHWDIIGGHVEPGETVERALIREIEEELGIRPMVFSLIASLREDPTDGEVGPVHHVFAIADWAGGAPANLCDEHVEIRWFSLDEIRQIPNKTPFDFDLLYERARSLLPEAAIPAGSEAN